MSIFFNDRENKATCLKYKYTAKIVKYIYILDLIFGVHYGLLLMDLKYATYIYFLTPIRKVAWDHLRYVFTKTKICQFLHKEKR